MAETFRNGIIRSEFFLFLFFQSQYFEGNLTLEEKEQSVRGKKDNLKNRPKHIERIFFCRRSTISETQWVSSPFLQEDTKIVSS